MHLKRSYTNWFSWYQPESMSIQINLWRYINPLESPKKFHCVNPRKTLLIRQCKNSEEIRREMESKKRGIHGGSSFQMPLHYPRYTKNDYQNMPEWQLDRLLAEYGLPVDGDMAYKREFARGAFLWPDFSQEQQRNSSPRYTNSFEHSSSPWNKKLKIAADFLYRVVGYFA